MMIGSASGKKEPKFKEIPMRTKMTNRVNNEILGHLQAEQSDLYSKSL